MEKSNITTNQKHQIPGFTLAFLILAVLLVACGSTPTAAPVTDSLPAEVDVQAADMLREKGAFILDVREPDEWAQFHIPDATLIPLGELASRLDEVPSDQPIVVVCRSGNRSQTGRDILLEAGFTRVTSMAAGVTDWQAQGLPITTGP